MLPPGGGGGAGTSALQACCYLDQGTWSSSSSFPESQVRDAALPAISKEQKLKPCCEVQEVTF